MTQKMYAFIKKIIAWLMSVVAMLGLTFGDTSDKDISRGQANSVAAYSTENADYTLDIDAADEIHDISDLLFGIFFEDINFAADGGLYAEKVINRSFEYGDTAIDDKLHGWKSTGNATFTAESSAPLNANNLNYAVITNTSSSPAGISNKGFLEGMAVEKDTSYDFSLYARALEGYSGSLTVRIVAGDTVAAQTVIPALTQQWTKYEAVLDCSLTATSDVHLQLLIGEGAVAVDMVSLFPEETYKGHGMRVDLAEKLEALNPSFLRFPGGCIIEGWDQESAYNWKNSIGVGDDGLPLEFEGGYGNVATRRYNMNLWSAPDVTEDIYPCYMSYGLGFFEYFQLAEDIGAIGVPVINCGLFCQARGRQPVSMDSEEFRQYIQDMHDLVEFCRGSADSTWGKVRASLGHPEPFELRYICIGNENWGEVYYERYAAFLEAFNAAKAESPELYEGIELIYSSGVDDGISGADYLASYEYAKDYMAEKGITDASDFAGATDHHYYNTPDWFFDNTDYYDEDNYSRDIESMTDTLYGGGLKVFVGEYASLSNRLESALSEAAYMTGLERNGDIVEMAAYAPLFGNLTATHWAPDLIWFNNHLSTASISYYVQQLFGINVGDKVLCSELKGAEIVPADLTGKVGLGTWWTSAEFDNVKVTSNETGRTLGSDKFTLPTDFWWNWIEATPGDWHIRNGKLYQDATELAYNNYGAMATFGKEEWSNYTYTLEATKLTGAEGFYIPFLIEDENNMFFWNIGGWENTKSGLQRVVDGAKTDCINGTMSPFTVEEGKTYSIKIVVDGVNIKGYIDDVLQFSYDAESFTRAQAYQVVSLDEETGDIIIKLVNATDSDRAFAVNMKNAGQVSSQATVYQVKGESLDDDNILGAKEDCTMESFTAEEIGESFNYTAPKYSVTAIRIHR